MSRCPTCNKETSVADNPYRPFCSERCKLIDFGKWVTEEFRVPGKTVSEEIVETDDEEPEAEED